VNPPSQEETPVTEPTAGRLLEGVSVVELTGEPSLPVSLAGKLFADLGATVVVLDAARPAGKQTAERVTAEDHTDEQQKAEDQTSEQPKTEQPKTEQPKTEQPKTEQPKTEQPKTEQPKTEQHCLDELLSEGKQRQSDRAVLATADLVLAPASAAGGYESVAAVNPDVIYGVITPFGPDADPAWRSSDLVLQAMGGMVATTGQPGEPPTKIGVPIGDHLGALYLAMGCLVGLIRRDRTGTGRQITVSQTDAIASALNNFIAEYKGKGHLPPSLGNRHLASSPWNLYPAADGYLVICLITDRQWDQLAELIGRDDLVGNPAFYGQQNRRPQADLIDEIVSAWSSGHPVAELLPALANRGIPCSAIATIEQVLADETLVRRGLLRSGGSQSGAGHRLGLGPVFRISESAAGQQAAVALAEGQGDGDHDRPLSGLRAVEFGVAAAGPVCGRILANLGVDVIKVEPPGGEIGRRVPPAIGTTSAVFHLNSSDKRSLCVNVATREGAAIARRVLEAADIVVENLAPGRLASWGLEFDAVAAARPGIIWTSVTGFGQDAAGARVRAYDTVVQAASGVMALTGFPDGLPTKAGISLSDFIGGVTGAFATTAALVARARAAASGQPARALHLDVAMCDATVWTTVSAWPGYLLTGKSAPRDGNSDHRVRWQGLIAAQDGQVAVTLKDASDEASLRTLTGAPNPAELDALIGHLADWAAGRSVAEVTDQLRSARIAAGPLTGVPALIADPGLNQRGVITTAIHPLDGEVAVMGVPIRLSDVPAHQPAAAPTLGLHTRDVLENVAGYPAAEAETLLADPAVHQA
jgi:crotonobetainyl-CoA:carnitine CoA-transferase CaiB-like acyl-CoA transferase